MRIKFVRSTRFYKQGDIADISRNEAFGLIDSGAAILTKDMTSQDHKITSDEGQADVKPTKLRTHNG
jgi:hypothetical protein